MNSSKSHTISSEEDLKAATECLVKQCEVIRKAYAMIGEPPLRRNAEGFEGLARIVIGQQLSVASAKAIWGRFAKETGDIQVSKFALLSDDKLRACGLSRPKIRTLRAISDAVLSGEIQFELFSRMTPEEVNRKLVAVYGIGPWTADIYCMFCLGYSDVWASGDLALQYAVRDVFSLDTVPNVNQMNELAERWRPWRGVAARILWAYYSMLKDNKSGAPV